MSLRRVTVTFPFDILISSHQTKSVGLLLNCQTVTVYLDVKKDIICCVMSLKQYLIDFHCG